MTDLGYSNGWKETPAIVKECRHERKNENVGRCLTRTTCEKCGYTFVTDSSD